MPYSANYPATVAEVLDDSMTFKPDALRAVRELAAAKPWRMSADERLELFQATARKLAAAYGIGCPRVSRGTMDCYTPHSNRIWLTGKMSVVTFLHEFGHARGFDERQTCGWSINLFRRCFPRSFARCRQVNHTLVNEGSR